MTVEYFGTYFNDEGFDFPRLLNDDFFQPVRLMYNNRHYVSASKLLVIAIDSIGFIEFGDSKQTPFIDWLDNYSDIEKLGITSDELWEHRNALLHMSSLNSRKVKSGRVRMLVGYIGQMPDSVELDVEKTGYYEILALIKIIGEACGKWCQTYDTDRSKIHAFVERYDLIASDARMLEIPLGDKK
jgi:hypothetical protein